MNQKKRDWIEMPKAAQQEAVQNAIADECSNVSDLLIKKNRAYGNSIFCPTGIFAKGGWEDAIRVRLDDKLARIRSTSAGENVADDYEDTILDIIGYLILLRVGHKLGIYPKPDGLTQEQIEVEAVKERLQRMVRG